MAAIINSVKKIRSVSPVVQRLLELCVHYQEQEQNNQNNATLLNVNHVDLNQQSKKKIKSLVKEINKSKRNGSVEELERAILHKDSTTKCITIRRSSDIAHEQSSNSNPIVDYCRLWRWPDLSNQNELKPIDYCTNAFHYNLDHICINPFHYERVPSTYSVCVPRLPSETNSNLHSSSVNDMISNQNPTDNINAQDFFLSSFGDVNNNNSQTTTTTPMDLDTISLNQNVHYEQVPFIEMHEWCRISYYEMSKRVGEQYRATQSQVIIDGFTHPSDAERFCLGGLTNIERTVDIDRARRFIGRGVKLIHIHGDIFAECISDNPVFVQSPIANKRLSCHPATVCKIPPNGRLKIFDNDDFIQILISSIREGYESVYNLMKICIIRMSFVKGWGVEYRRPSVTCTPCWIEIYLDAPLKWLDTVLSTIGGPRAPTTSVSE